MFFIVGAFIVPYLIMLFVLGIPLFYLELSLGQAVRKGPVKAWFKISPNLGGIGIAAIIVCAIVSLYYNVLIAWVFFFFFNSFQKNLPWGTCFGNYVLELSPSEIQEIKRNFSGNVLELSSCFNASSE